MESLQAEAQPFGIQTMIVNPGFFRTELLTAESTEFAELAIADYDERRKAQLAFWRTQNGKQSGDPAKLARALVALVDRQEMPQRFVAGADAVQTAEQVAATLPEQVNANRALSFSLAFE
jgi:NAD(P)-dependent dehydrogenase (short-subunit alcohol dehydrogenase family)